MSTRDGMVKYCPALERIAAAGVSRTGRRHDAVRRIEHTRRGPASWSSRSSPMPKPSQPRQYVLAEDGRMRQAITS